MRFKKNNKHNRGLRVNILEKAITKPNQTCICPVITIPISNGDEVLPMTFHAARHGCPAHRKGGS